MQDRRLFLFSLCASVSLAAKAEASGAPKAAAKPVKSGNNDALQKRVTGAQSYVAAPQVAVGLPRGLSFDGLIAVDAGLDIPEEKLRKSAEKTIPRIRDSLREALVRYAAIYHRRDSVPDADQIQRMMQAAADTALQKKGATLLLVSVMVFRGY